MALDCRRRRKGHVQFPNRPAEYRNALARYGLDLGSPDPASVAARIAASPIKMELVAAIDDWALVESDKSVRNQLLEIASRADSGDWIDRLRDPSLRDSRHGVAKLAAEANVDAISGATLSILVRLMIDYDVDPSLILSAGRTRYPADFELAFLHAQWKPPKGKIELQLGPYEAAPRCDPTTPWFGIISATCLCRWTA